MDGYPEPLERIFQKVEQESERRAREIYITERAVSTEVLNSESSTPYRNGNIQRRGSISITTFGQLASDPSLSAHANNHAFRAASHLMFYQPKAANDSTASFPSGSLANDDAHLDADTHVTQMEQIAGRQSISKAMGGLLPRRLSRARSANVAVTRDANVVIGVSVEEATVETSDRAETTHATVRGPEVLRHSTSRPAIGGTLSGRQNWVAKAKGFTQKFRRKATQIPQ